MTTSHSRRDTHPSTDSHETIVVTQPAPRASFGTTLFAFALGAAAVYGYSTYLSQPPATPVATPAAPSDSTKLAVLEAKLAEVSKQLDENKRKLEQVGGEVSTVSTTAIKAQSDIQEKLSKLETGATQGVDDATVKALREEMAAISSHVTALKTDQEKQARTHSNMVLALQQLDALEAALKNGQPYDAPLAKIKSLASEALPDAELIKPLVDHAKDGVVSEADLLVNFREMAAIAVPQGIMSSKDSSFSDRMRARIAHIISIRKVGEQLGDSDEARIARAEAALEQGQVDAALRQVELLSDAAKLPFAEWLINAYNYRESWDGLNKLRRTLYGLPPVEPPAPVVEEESQPADSDTSPAEGDAQPDDAILEPEITEPMIESPAMPEEAPATPSPELPFLVPNPPVTPGQES